MYCSSKYSKEKYYHTENCPIFARIKKKNRILMHNKSDMQEIGLIACPLCSRVNAKYKKEQHDIENYARKTGYKVWYSNDAIYIRTNISSWKIICEGHQHNIHLYHENFQVYRWCKKNEEGDYIKEYHRQNQTYSATIMGYLEYIKEHDTWKTVSTESYKSMPRKTKKQKKLYDKAKYNAQKSSVRRVVNLIDEMKIERERRNG